VKEREREREREREIERERRRRRSNLLQHSNLIVKLYMALSG
jgi:hypothetical protein